MFLKLWKTDWLAFRRSPMWKKEIFQGIMLAFLGLYMAVNLLVLGLFCGSMVEEYFPNRAAIVTMNGIIGYYFLADLVLRFMFQKFPSVHINRYILHPISKSTLSKYLIAKSWISVFNIIPFFFFIPFFMRTVSESWIQSSALSWMGLMVLLVLLNQVISFLLDRSFGHKPYIGLGIMGVIVGLFYFDMNGYLKLSVFFSRVIRYFSDHSIWLILPVALIMVLLLVSYYYLKNSAYVDDSGMKKKNVNEMHIGLFDKFGSASKWMQFEAKLIWRNKRAKQFLLISMAFVLYPLAFQSALEMRSMMIFVAMFVTGAFVMNYGQLLFSWNSNHFDMILTSASEYTSFLLAKYYIMICSVAVLIILCLPYAYFNQNLFMIAFAMAFFNAGVTSFALIIFSIYFSKKIDTQKGTMFNHEGLGMAHYLLMMPVLILPILFYLAFRLFGYGNVGIIMLSIIGLIGLLFHKAIIAKIATLFFRKKYVLQKNMSS